MIIHHAKNQLDSSKRSRVIPSWKSTQRRRRQRRRRRRQPSGLNYSPRRNVFRRGQKLRAPNHRDGISLTIKPRDRIKWRNPADSRALVYNLPFPTENSGPRGVRVTARALPFSFLIRQRSVDAGDVCTQPCIRQCQGRTTTRKR